MSDPWKNVNKIVIITGNIHLDYFHTLTNPFCNLCMMKIIMNEENKTKINYERRE